MNESGINMKVLEKQAENSEHSESYQTLERNEHFKIGTGARMVQEKPSFFLEVIIKLCNEGDKVNTAILERKVKVLESMEQDGFILKCEDDSSVCCEKEIKKDGMKKVLEQVKEALDELYLKKEEN